MKRIRDMIIGHHGIVVDVIYDDKCKVGGFTKEVIIKNTKLPTKAYDIKEYNIDNIAHIFNKDIADIIERHSWAVLKGKYSETKKKVRILIRLYKLCNKDRFLCYYLFK